MGDTNTPGVSTPPGTDFSAAVESLAGLLFPTEAQDATESAATPEPTVENTGSPAETQDPVPETAPPQRSRKLKLDGTEVEVTEDEAYLGYMRQSDYTRKTQQAAEVRKKADEEAASAREQRLKYAQSLEAVDHAMVALVPKEPDWKGLRDQLTAEQFTQAHAEYSTWKQQYDLVQTEKKKVAEEAAKDFEGQRQKLFAEEAEKLYGALPEWRDENVAKTERAKIRTYAKQRMGLTDEQVLSIMDHRHVLAIRDAMQWDDLQQKKGKATPPPSKLKSAPAGTPEASRPAASTDKARALERSRKTGRIEDAAKAFLHIPGLTD